MIAMKIYRALAASGDKAGFQDLRKTLAENIRKTGIDLREMDLTKSGFVRR